MASAFRSASALNISRILVRTSRRGCECVPGGAGPSWAGRHEVSHRLLGVESHDIMQSFNAHKNSHIIQVFVHVIQLCIAPVIYLFRV